jgi:MFS family permease
MNLGTWLLSAAALANGSAWFLDRFPALLLKRSRSAHALGDKAGLVGGVLGLPLAGYTSVLLANTAVPLWQHTRRSLPAVFLSSSLTSGASALELYPLSRRERRAASAIAVVAKLAELGAGLLFQFDARRQSEIARPLREGASAKLFQAARWLTFASLAFTLVAGKKRPTRVAAGISGTLGAMAMRFAIAQAGKTSARDPKATFGPQRRSIEGQMTIGADRTHRLIDATVDGARG